MKDSASMYLEYEGQMQREGLFQQIATFYLIKSALYPGSYIHISPSFFIPEVVYVDTDKKSQKFFTDPSFHSIIDAQKTYSRRSVFRFYAQDYTKELPEPLESFDLLISQYAGFVSQSCKKYLRIGGLLMANNSHGDAGVAFLDPEFLLVAVVQTRSGKFFISEKDLEIYFKPKKSIPSHSMKYLLSLKRGIGYQKSATHYIFQKNQ